MKSALMSERIKINVVCMQNIMNKANYSYCQGHEKKAMQWNRDGVGRIANIMIFIIGTIN